MSSFTADRLAQLMSQIGPEQAVLLSNPSDISYFSGFSYLVPEEREGLLLVTSAQAYLFHASFSPVPQTIGLKLMAGVAPFQLTTHLRTILSQQKFSELMIDKSRLFAEEYEALLQIKDLTYSTLDRPLVWRQRMIKDDQEIATIRQASRIAAHAIETARPQLKIGMTELQFKQLLESEMTHLGSQKPAFPTIVAFGSHTALPHHQPTTKQLETEMAVLIDFGATVDGYRSDMTVSFWFGSQPPADYTKIAQVVHDAYQAGLKTLASSSRADLTAAAIDQAARDLITAAKYGPLFIHTTGHGVGLDIHEQPSLHWQNQLSLEARMVITIEPGIYIPETYGYRHEHTVLLTDSSYEELTKI